MHEEQFSPAACVTEVHSIAKNCIGIRCVVVKRTDEPSLPYVAVLLNAEDEVLSAKSVPTAEAGEDLVAKIFGEFTNARPSGKN